MTELNDLKFITSKRAKNPLLKQEFCQLVPTGAGMTMPPSMTMDKNSEEYKLFLANFFMGNELLNDMQGDDPLFGIPMRRIKAKVCVPSQLLESIRFRCVFMFF